MSFGFDDFTPSAPAANTGGQNILTVTALSNQLRGVVEASFGRVAVEGEVSGLKIAASGHIYFSLKDSDAVISGIIWRGVASRLAVRPEEGMQVVIYGKVTTYAQRSNYQIIVDRLEPAGQGALMARFEELKRQLTAEGLFDDSRKKPLPFLPKKIGIITSPTGAVIDDMLSRLTERFGRHVLLWPVKVQGVGAKEDIAAAIAGFNNLPDSMRPDVLIVARGGGSLEDLWPFNEEVVVRAVAASDIPIISGVGHEPDITLCDYAADKRAATPTAAAVEVVPDRQELASKLSQLAHRVLGGIKTDIRHKGEKLRLYRRALPDPQSTLNQAYLRFTDKQERLERAMESRLSRTQDRLGQSQKRLTPELLRHFFGQHQQQLNRLYERLQAPLPQRIGRAQTQLEGMGKLLDQLSPHAPLARGYTYITDKNGEVVRSADTPQTDVTVHFSDGQRQATLQKKD